MMKRTNDVNNGVDNGWTRSGMNPTLSNKGSSPASTSLATHLLMIIAHWQYCIPFFFCYQVLHFFGLLRRLAVWINYSGFDIILIHRYYYFRNPIIGFVLILFWDSPTSKSITRHWYPVGGRRFRNAAPPDLWPFYEPPMSRFCRNGDRGKGMKRCEGVGPVRDAVHP
jgi:hypothetical protein